MQEKENVICYRRRLTLRPCARIINTPPGRGRPQLYCLPCQQEILQIFHAKIYMGDQCIVCNKIFKGHRRRDKLTCSRECRTYLCRLKDKDIPPVRETPDHIVTLRKKRKEQYDTRRNKGLCVDCGAQALSTGKLLSMGQARVRAKRKGTTPEREYFGSLCDKCYDKRKT